MNNTIRLLAGSMALAAALITATVGPCSGQAPVETMEFEPVKVACICGQTGTAIDPRMLMEFDLSGLPDSAVVQFAGLRLANQGEIVWRAPYVPVLAGALTRDWDEANASWYQASGNQAWDTPGGDWDPALTAYRVIVRVARAPSTLVLTDIVTQWASGSIPNYGLIVMMPDPEELADVVPYFNSQFLKPVLTVRYVLPE
jgi:hypothetical protein